MLQGCGALWQGITLAPETLNPLAIPGGQLDMSNSSLLEAEIGILAQNQSKIRLVNNTFTNNYISLRVTGFVPFINFGNSAEFKDNTFTANASYLAPTYDAVTSPLTAIHFINATTFFIGQDFANPPTVTNTINRVRRGIMIDNSFGLGIYGLQIFDLTGIVNLPTQSNQVAVRISSSRNINVKYCNIFGTTTQTRPWHGIVTFGNSGHKQIYHDNTISVRGTRGIYVTGLSFPSTEVDMQNNQIIANQTCIDVDNFANGNGSRLFLNKNLLYPRNSRGFNLQNIGAPYSIYDNDVTSTLSVVSPGAIFQSTGRGDVFKNRINMATDDDNAIAIFNLGQTSNCKIYENTFYGNAANPNGLFDIGINTAAGNNIIFCCNSVDNTTYGTQFNFANSDVRFYTTQYGTHDSALYFPPATTLNAQNNTGNNWAGATTSLDAYYNGTLNQAQANAPFRTNPANINSTLISPIGWFFLFGTDPSCAETSTITCDDLDLPTGFTELTPDDLAGLSAANYDNEDVLRFEQKRQLYRKLKENPGLVSWNTDVTTFYNASANNFVGAIYGVDDAWRNLFAASASLSASYESLTADLESLEEQVSDIYSAFPGSSSTEQASMLDALHDLTNEIREINEDMATLVEQENDDYGERLADLLALNDALDAVEIWETEEKEMNDLFFRYCGGLIDSFSTAQQSQIAALAEKCPQYYGAGVYKARFLREQTEGASRHYVENHCIGAERSDNRQRDLTASFAVLPNPASDQVLVRLPEEFSHGSTITMHSLDGRTVFSLHCQEGTLEQILNVQNTQPGVYWLSLSAENTVPLSTKIIIIR